MSGFDEMTGELRRLGRAAPAEVAERVKTARTRLGSVIYTAGNTEVLAASDDLIVALHEWLATVEQILEDGENAGEWSVADELPVDLVPVDVNGVQP